MQDCPAKKKKKKKQTRVPRATHFARESRQRSKPSACRHRAPSRPHRPRRSISCKSQGLDVLGRAATTLQRHRQMPRRQAQSQDHRPPRRAQQSHAHHPTPLHPPAQRLPPLPRLPRAHALARPLRKRMLQRRVLVERRMRRVEPALAARVHLCTPATTATSLPLGRALRRPCRVPVMARLREALAARTAHTPCLASATPLASTSMRLFSSS